MESEYRARLMAREDSERFAMGAGMFDTARTMVLSSFPRGMEDHEIRVALLRRFYGRDLDPTQIERIERALCSQDR
jgi:hypothetical protein